MVFRGFSGSAMTRHNHPSAPAQNAGGSSARSTLPPETHPVKPRTKRSKAIPHMRGPSRWVNRRKTPQEDTVPADLRA